MQYASGATVLGSKPLKWTPGQARGDSVTVIPGSAPIIPGISPVIPGLTRNPFLIKKRPVIRGNPPVIRKTIPKTAGGAAVLHGKPRKWTPGQARGDSMGSFRDGATVWPSSRETHSSFRA